MTGEGGGCGQGAADCIEGARVLVFVCAWVRKVLGDCAEFSGRCGQGLLVRREPFQVGEALQVRVQGTQIGGRGEGDVVIGHVDRPAREYRQPAGECASGALGDAAQGVEHVAAVCRRECVEQIDESGDRFDGAVGGGKADFGLLYSVVGRGVGGPEASAVRYVVPAGAAAFECT